MDEQDVIVFEASIRASRSMGRRGVRIVAGFLILVSTLTTVMFWLLGAWPVAGFAGAEIGVAVWLLARNAANEDGSEMLRLTSHRLLHIRKDKRGREHLVDWPRPWLRVELRERQGRVPALYLARQGRRQEIAHALGEAEKRDLARAVRSALARLPDEAWSDAPAAGAPLPDISWPDTPRPA